MTAEVEKLLYEGKRENPPLASQETTDALESSAGGCVGDRQESKEERPALPLVWFPQHTACPVA